MQLSMIIFTAVLASTSALAAPPAYEHARSVEPVYNLIYRRTVPMHCASHNNQIMCGTTHECQSVSATPNRKHGAHPTLNGFCASECKCRPPPAARKPLGEISGNVQRGGKFRTRQVFGDLDEPYN